MNEKLIIAVDGPAGSGKSTVSKLIARRLGLLYIDTGAMYRALTLKALKENIDLDDEGSLTKLAERVDINLTHENGNLRVYLDGKDVSKDIRTPELTGNVKFIARVPGVRAHMVELQRKVASQGSGAVLEGRDIGTVVFPQAKNKFYLDASVDERAKRRCKELKEDGQSVDAEQIKRDILIRDESDKTRKVAPLKEAKDAVRIDTTNLSIEEVVDRIISMLK